MFIYTLFLLARDHCRAAAHTETPIPPWQPLNFCVSDEPCVARPAPHQKAGRACQGWILRAWDEDVTLTAASKESQQLCRHSCHSRGAVPPLVGCWGGNPCGSRSLPVLGREVQLGLLWLCSLKCTTSHDRPGSGPHSSKRTYRCTQAGRSMAATGKRDGADRQAWEHRGCAWGGGGGQIGGGGEGG